MADYTESTPLLFNSVVIRPTKQRKIACTLVLLSVLFERVAYYSLTANLVFYLTKEPLCWDAARASGALLIFEGIMYIVGLFAGWFSDSYFRRFSTIAFGFVIYIIGYAYLPIIGHYTKDSYCPLGDTRDERSTGSSQVKCNDTLKTPFALCNPGIDVGDAQCSTTLTISLVLVSIGSGIVRTNMAPFGGDQVRDDGLKTTTTFFTFFYWAINIGSLFAVAGVTFVQQNVNFFCGYMTPSICLTLASLIFLCGKKFYVNRPSENRMFSTIFNIYRNARQVKKSQRDIDPPPPNFIDYAKRSYGGRFDSGQVDDIKKLRKACIVFAMLIPYWLCYSQMFGNVFLLQGLHLRLDFDEDFPTCPDPSQRNDLDDVCNLTWNNTTVEVNKVWVPAASLSIFNLIFIILTLPVVQKLYKSLSSCGIAVYTWRRMSFGMILASLALLAGGLLEYMRLNDIQQCGYHRQKISDTVYESSPKVSIWWQIPQYSLLGASEVFTIVTGIEYSYMISPPAMQGIIMGLFWAAAGVGNLIAISLPYIFHVAFSNIWNYPKLINCDRLDVYLYILAGFLILWAVLFGIVGKFCRLELNKEAIEKPALVNESTPRMQRRNLNSSYRTSKMANNKQGNSKSRRSNLVVPKGS